MRLSKLFANLQSPPQVHRDRQIHNLVLDSRQVTGGDVFCALAQDSQARTAHIKQALQRGAAVVLADPVIPFGIDRTAPIIRMTDLHRLLPILAANRYGIPSLMLVAVTGTNGKTSVAWMAAQLLGRLNLACGYIGTLGCHYGTTSVTGKLTTPDIFTIYRQLGQMQQAGMRACIVEASSHALAQNRLGGLRFHQGIFTNLSHDHLDYHGDMDSYRRAKWLLWDQCDSVIANADDPATATIADDKVTCTYGFDTTAGLRCTSYSATTDGLQWTVESQGTSSDCGSPVVGRYMLNNLLAITALAYQLGYPINLIRAQLPAIATPPGRMEKIADSPTVIIDYAHTPDALARLLTSLREICDQQQRIGLVFGCGGDRDTIKRPAMGKLAARFADKVFVTSDNPRSESIMAIIDQIVAGVDRSRQAKVETVPDRREAIASAINWCKPSDCLAIAGKGHETTQVIGDQSIAFDDTVQAKRILEER